MSDLWQAIRHSPIGRIRAQEFAELREEGDWLSGAAELRSFRMSYYGDVRVAVFEEGLEMTLRLTRESLRNRRHDDAIELTSAFLLSHPNPQPSWCAVACAVGALQWQDFEWWPGESSIEEHRDCSLPSAIAALRGSRGYFRIDGYPSAYDGWMSITNTGAHDVEILISDRQWWSMGIRHARFIPWPWLAELRRADELGGPARTDEPTDAAGRARRAVARLCLARIELEQLIGELRSLQPEDAALEAWIEEAVGICAEARNESLGPARVRNRLSSLLERGTGVAWPVTLEERSERSGRMPASVARRFLVDDPAREPADPHVAAGAVIARALIGELTPVQALEELDRLAPSGALEQVRRSLEEARSAERHYDNRFISAEERDELYERHLTAALVAVVEPRRRAGT